MRLDRCIGQVLLLHVQAGLHLDQGPPVGATLQDVHLDDDAVAREGGLVEGSCPPGHGRTGCINAPGGGLISEADQLATGDLIASQDPHLPAGLDDGAGILVRYQLSGVCVMHSPPQLLMTLQTG
jgi:hypothetical protein